MNSAECDSKLVSTCICASLSQFVFLSVLNVTCGIGAVPGRETFICNSNNRLVSTVCSFDGGPFENCSFPLVVGIDEFGTDNHTLVVTVVDVFGQSVDFVLTFHLTERKRHFVITII